jgi:carbon monoxide dehydrogenase subunit G
MDMQGSRVLAASRQQAWDALNDPEVLKACIPGCDRMEPAGENQYALGMAVKVGPVSARFGGKVLLQDVNPPSSYTLRFEGQGGAAGFGKGTAQVRLEPREPGCELHYTVNAQVGGRIAQVGQRLIDGVARSMAEDFFKRFDAEMQRRYPPPAVTAGAANDGSGAAPAAAPEATAAAPAQRAGAAVPVWAWIVGAVVVLAGAWWLWR